jgi:hypothetical protein
MGPHRIRARNHEETDMHKKAFLFVLLSLAVPLHATAGSREEIRKSIEASMSLTGSITVGPDGNVREYTIDKQDKVAPAILDMLGRDIGAWKFEPQQEDKPVAIKNRMYLRLVANRNEAGDYLVRISSTYFAPYQDEDPQEPEMKQAASNRKNMTPPHYPPSAAMAGAQGTAFLLLRIDAQGRVEDAVAEMVNLRVIGTPQQMEGLRKLFADASLAAAKKWTLPPPPEGKAYDTVRVPVDYCLDRCGAYGQWESYVPGPVQKAPWPTGEEGLGFSPDALPGGGVYPVGESGGLKLLTPLQGGS